MGAKVADRRGRSCWMACRIGRKLLIFGIMAFGQFMALLDIQIVAASLNSIQAGLSAGPDEIAWVQTAYLMAEIVDDPARGLSEPGAVDALAVRGFGRAVHAFKPDVRHGVEHPVDDRVPRHPGLCRRRDGADRVRHRLFDVLRQEPRDDPGDSGHGLDASAHTGAHGGRLDHRRIELALAVLRQHHSRRRHRGFAVDCWARSTSPIWRC